jgi:hypothetical protein
MCHIHFTTVASIVHTGSTWVPLITLHAQQPCEVIIFMVQACQTMRW